MKRAETILPLDQVPARPEAGGETQPNGDVIYDQGDHRWRYSADGTLKYYIRRQPGRGQAETPWAAMYEGAR